MKRLIWAIGFVVMMAGSAYGIDDNAGTCVAPFLKMKVSARSAGMGGVAVTTCYGADALYSNPASLANLWSKQVLFMHHQWLEEVNLNYLACTLPIIENQGIGASINWIDTGEMKKTTYSNPDGNGKFDTGAMVITVGYGININYKIDVGASCKYISQKIDDKTGRGLGMDIGILYWLENLKLGAVIQNIGLSKVKFIEKEEKLPLVIKVGTGYRIKNLFLGMDIAKPEDNSIQTNIGVQYWLASIFALRAGYDSSIDEGSRITAGVGIFLSKFTFDAAYLPAGKFGSTFRLSTTMEF